jgi:hypothetical protein
MVMLIYKNLGSISFSSSAFTDVGSTIQIGPLVPTIPANQLYFLLGGWQGFMSTTTWNTPSGYTQRTLANDNVTAIGYGSISSFDEYMPPAQSSYSVVTTINTTGATANLQLFLFAYNIVNISVPHRAVIY